MLAYGGALVNLVPPPVVNRHLVNQLHALASSGQICQECVLHLRPLKHLHNGPINLNLQCSIFNVQCQRTPPPPPPPWKPPPPPWNDECPPPPRALLSRAALFAAARAVPLCITE